MKEPCEMDEHNEVIIKKQETNDEYCMIRTKSVKGLVTTYLGVSVYKPLLTSHYFQLKCLHLPFVVTAQAQLIPERTAA